MNNNTIRKEHWPEGWHIKHDSSDDSYCLVMTPPKELMESIPGIPPIEGPKMPQMFLAEGYAEYQVNKYHEDVANVISEKTCAILTTLCTISPLENIKSLREGMENEVREHYANKGKSTQITMELVIKKLCAAVDAVVTSRSQCN